MTTTTHPDAATPAADAALDPVAQTFACIDDLLCRYTVQAETVALLRRRLADLHDERALREAQAQLAAEGKNETERAARLRLRLAADGDYQRCREAEKNLRVDIASALAALFVTRQRLAVCLALLRLAAGAPADTGDTGDADAAMPTPDTTPEDPS